MTLHVVLIIMLKKYVCSIGDLALQYILSLQIPPPKPPPPEMHFIPNPANSEFVYLLGLEECVSKILHEDREVTTQPMPFTCSQCNTDFTPTWKWDKEAKGTYEKLGSCYLPDKRRL